MQPPDRERAPEPRDARGAGAGRVEVDDPVGFFAGVDDVDAAVAVDVDACRHTSSYLRWPAPS